MSKKTKSDSRASSKKLSVGFFSFTCCAGCQFTILFIDKILDLLNKVDVKHFQLIKEHNLDSKFDLAFVEGAITKRSELLELKKIRENSKFVVALGACACHGGVPAMRNFIENPELAKYVYNRNVLSDSITTSGIDQHIKVDYYLRGCPIIQDEFVNFFNSFLKHKPFKEFSGPVCSECPRRGKNCFLSQKVVCLGAITRGGCKAACTSQNIPCMLCRGPLDRANFASEVSLFKSWGLSVDEIKSKLTRFKNIDLDSKGDKHA